MGHTLGMNHDYADASNGNQACYSLQEPLAAGATFVIASCFQSKRRAVGFTVINPSF